MCTEKEIDHLLNILTENAKSRIQQALKWARKYEIISGGEYTSQQIAALVFLYESAEPKLSFEISDKLCNICILENNFPHSWLRDTFHFNKQEVYNAFKSWMKTESDLGCLIAYNMNVTYEIMQEAAYNGDNDLLEWLLSRNIEVDFRDSSRETALHAAAAKGRIETVKFLLEQGASKFALNSERLSPFDLAFDSMFFHICDLLYTRSIENVTTESKMLDVVRAGNIHKVMYLLERTTGIQDTWNYIWEALTIAVENGYTGMVDVLLHYCPTLRNAPNGYNKKVLTKAIVKGDHNIVEKLLAAGFQMDDPLLNFAKDNKMYQLLNLYGQTRYIDVVDQRC